MCSSDLSRAAFDELLAATRARVIASHSNAAALLPESERHLTDAQIAALRDQSRALNLGTFPGPVIRFYLGEISAEEVMAAVRKGSLQEQKEQLCEASFYVGEEALLRGNRDEAARLFRQAIGTGLTYFYEYQGAAVELQRLGR